MCGRPGDVYVPGNMGHGPYSPAVFLEVQREFGLAAGVAAPGEWGGALFMGSCSCPALLRYFASLLCSEETSYDYEGIKPIKRQRARNRRLALCVLLL